MLDNVKHRKRNATEIAITLGRLAATAASVPDFCDQAIRLMATPFEVTDAAIFRGLAGNWTWVASLESATSVPTMLLADAADQEQWCETDGWFAVPLDVPGQPGWLACGRLPSKHDDAWRRDMGQLMAVTGSYLSLLSRVLTAGVREDCLAKTLDAVTRWTSMRDPRELLDDITVAATEMMQAEVATIYVWNRKTKQFITATKPPDHVTATVNSDELPLAYQVVQTGVPRRVVGVIRRDPLGSDTDEATGIDRPALMYVSLVSRKGRTLGVLELRSKAFAPFSDVDEQIAVEFARHAAAAMEDKRAAEALIGTTRQSVKDSTAAPKLIGVSPALRELVGRIDRVAPTELPVLVLGENGTGKEIVSQLIHEHSNRSSKSFLAVNCAALTETLLESELFGHEKGAFTDAHEPRIGKFEAASDGSLFLDEIGELSARAQAKLLRVLDDKTVTRVGGTQAIHTDARLIAATNRDLADMVRQQLFREDLFFRLTVVTLQVPPLRERGNDVLILAEHFLRQAAEQADRAAPELTEAARKKLLAYHWPGNVRELRNLIERVVYLTNSVRVDATDLDLLSNAGRERSVEILDVPPLTDATHNFQLDYIQRQISAAGGNMTEAARRLGLHRSNLYRKMRQLGMPTQEE